MQKLNFLPALSVFLLLTCCTKIAYAFDLATFKPDLELEENINYYNDASKDEPQVQLEDLPELVEPKPEIIDAPAKEPESANVPPLAPETTP